MERVKVGIIGAGLWGECHVEAYKAIPYAEVVAIADVRPGLADEIAAKHKIPNAFEHYEELCALKEIQAISVVTSESEHCKPVQAAARAGKHLLVEKPMARSVAEVDDMIEAAREADVILMPGHLLRFEARYAMVKEMLDRQEIGAVASIQTRRNRTKANFQKYGHTHPIFAVAVHDIDLMLWYTQSKVQRVRGYQRFVQGASMPDLVWGVLEFSNGALGILESTWLTPDKVGVFSNDSLQLITGQGIARIDLVDGGLSFWMESGFYVPDTVAAPRIRGRIEGSLAAELGYFLACVMKSEKPEIVTAEDAREGIAVATALIESCAKNEDVVLH